MKTLNVIKIDLNWYRGKCEKCEKCAFNNNFICFFVKCFSTEREDRENIYFKLIDMNDKSE